MNSVNISGRLARPAELRQTTSGKSVTNFDVAVRRPFSKDTTDWISVVCWNQSAEYVCRYGEKGSYIEVTGSIQTRQYTDKNEQKRTAVEVVADNCRFVESKKDSEQVSRPAQKTADVDDGFSELEDDGDLPF